jgi:TolB-like protein/Tfp pilus assembly protein PilF
MALRSGAAELRDGDYFGPTLNRVARLMAAAHGGQTLLSDVVHGSCNGALPSGVVLKPLGVHTLKDVPEPAPVFQLCYPGLQESFSPLRTHAAVDATPSIAVMPFIDMSHEQENEYFADGLSEELLNVLAKIRGVRVASRSSAFSFKGKHADVRTVAEKLNVANVLEGSVRKAGKRVRITAQLVEAATDSNLWSDTYDRDLEDIFAVQDDIAQCVVQELRRIFAMESPAAASPAIVKEVVKAAVEEEVKAAVEEEVKAAVKGRSESAEAYALYLQGQYFRDQYTREGAAKALTYYQRALALDPDYALAWAGLSRVYCDQAGQDWIPRTEGYSKAREAAQKALELQPDSAEAHIAIGWVRRTADWDWKGAEAAFGRALELAPGNTLALNGAAILAGNLGRLDESIGMFRRAVELDPLNVAVNRNLGFYSLAGGALDEAETALNQALELKPQGGLTNTWLALVRLAQGRPDDALETAKREVNEVFRLLALSIVHHARGETAESDAALGVIVEKFHAVSSYQIAQAYAFRNDPGKAFEWLERTFADRDPGVVYVKMDPLMRGLQTDPRWPTFLEKIGLAD